MNYSRFVERRRRTTKTTTTIFMQKSSPGSLLMYVTNVGLPSAGCSTEYRSSNSSWLPAHTSYNFLLLFNSSFRFFFFRRFFRSSDKSQFKTATFLSPNFGNSTTPRRNHGGETEEKQSEQKITQCTDRRWCRRQLHKATGMAKKYEYFALLNAIRLDSGTGVV